MTRSVRRLLVVTLISVITLTSLLVAWLAYREGRIEAAELFDAKLAHSARVLSALSDEALSDPATRALGEPMVIQVWPGTPEGRGDELVTADGHAYETKLQFQVWDDAGRLLLRSHNAAPQALAPREPGFRRVQVDGRAWRVFTLRSPAGLWYQSAEDDAIREEIGREIARDLLLPLLAGIPVMALLIWFIVSWGCRPLMRLADALSRRAPDSLERIPLGRVPLEVQPLVEAVNDFMQRLGEALARERRLSSDAAHELRTPIAAVRVHARNALDAIDPAQRARALDAVSEGAQRLERLVEQLLVLGRLEPGAALPVPDRVDLGACAAEQVASLVEAGLGGELEVEVAGAETGAIVCGDAVALGVLIRNLVDNALRYTPAGGDVRVSVARDDGHADLSVEDSGPGIDVAARERVFDRFHRELGSGASGSGLGLSIVRRAAELHGASLTLDVSPTLGGLRVRVRLPLAPAT